MRIWMDTEFNGFKGELLSIAMVGEDGSEFYEIFERTEAIVPWVMENVIPVMNSHTGASKVPRPAWAIRQDLQWWLMHRDVEGEGIYIIADWPEDIAHFCRLLLTDTPGERINTPMLRMEIRRDFDAPSKVPHNALEDARAMRRFDGCLECGRCCFRKSDHLENGQCPLLCGTVSYFVPAWE